MGCNRKKWITVMAAVSVAEGGQIHRILLCSKDFRTLERASHERQLRQRSCWLTENCAGAKSPMIAEGVCGRSV